MSIERLRAIMARLRDPQAGCPWDRSIDMLRAPAAGGSA